MITADFEKQAIVRVAKRGLKVQFRKNFHLARTIVFCHERLIVQSICNKNLLPN